MVMKVESYNASSHPLYKTWSEMIRRCKPTERQANYYYARGITVCDRWRGSFASFVEDMGPKPTPTHSIDRIDNNAGYYPDNCRWATKAEQQQNRGVFKNTQVYNGVKWNNHLQRWEVSISIEGKTRNVARCRDLDEALSIRLSAEAEYWL